MENLEKWGGKKNLIFASILALTGLHILTGWLHRNIPSPPLSLYSLITYASSKASQVLAWSHHVSGGQGIWMHPCWEQGGVEG